MSRSRRVLEKKDRPHDTRISDSPRSEPGGWTASRFGFSGFDLYVSAMVQHLSLQKGRARPTARMHEPVDGRLSIGRT